MIQISRHVVRAKRLDLRRFVHQGHCSETSAPNNNNTEQSELPELSKQEIRTIMKERGSRCTLDVSSHLPYAKSIGHVQTFRQFDGTVRRIVLPKQAYSKTKARVINLDWKGESKSENSISTGWITLAESAFSAGLPSISKNCVSGPNYYFENGLRKVEPYFLGIRSTAREGKFPGVGCTIVDYFSKRFPTKSRKFFEIAVKLEQLVVNLHPVTVDYVVKDNDVISHVFHRHETPVLDRNIHIIYESEKVLVVDKPPSWPVHSCGNHLFNSLVFVLAKEYNYHDLKTIHRLDKNTSGVYIMGKGYGSNIQTIFLSKETKKEYLTLVIGRFPEGEIACTLPLGSYRVSSFDRMAVKPSKDRSAITIFRRIKFGEKTNTSLVACTLKTGRTHQIRLHLKELGFHIVNDNLYNRDEVDYEQRKDFLNTKVEPLVREMEAELERTKRVTPSDEVPTIEDLEARYAKYKFCLNCQDESLYNVENQVSSIHNVMCLHSWKYTVGGQVFQSKLPDWAEHPESIVS